jgi:hypothetical protein
MPNRTLNAEKMVRVVRMMRLILCADSKHNHSMKPEEAISSTQVAACCKLRVRSRETHQQVQRTVENPEDPLRTRTGVVQTRPRDVAPEERNRAANEKSQYNCPHSDEQCRLITVAVRAQR